VLTRVDDSTLATCWWIARTDPAPKGGAARSRDLSNAANLVVYDPMIAFQLDGATMPDDLGRLRATVDQIAPKATVRVVVPAGMTAVVDDFVAHGAERVAGTEADDVLAAIRVGWPSDDRGGS
jgi:hypothetical protein